MSLFVQTLHRKEVLAFEGVVDPFLAVYDCELTCLGEDVSALQTSAQRQRQATFELPQAQKLEVDCLMSAQKLHATDVSAG